MKEFWKEDHLANIIPRGFGEYPEGFAVPAFLKEWLQPIPFQSVVDLGCGYGRLSTAFSQESYLGIDVNPEAILAAKEKFPGYRFLESKEDQFPKADLYMAYTVFLHLLDDEVHHILDLVDTSYFLVAEILGSEWRRKGNPPVYNREFDEYIKIFHQHQYRMVDEISKPYARYSEDPQYQSKNCEISFLLFQKKIKIV